jgi:hypothetical protein
MTEDLLARHVRAAVESFDVPAYPTRSLSVAPAAGGATVVGRRRRNVYANAALAACILAIVGVSAAIAVPPDIPDRVVRAFERAGVHLRNRNWIPLETREVSLDEARAAADFTVLMPHNVRLVKTLLAVDAARRRAFVSLVLEVPGRNQLVLEESRVDLRHPPGRGPIIQVNAAGRVRKLPPPIAWRVGDTQLTIGPYDARSRAFAERLRRETLLSGRSSR